jgi:hypothetical protein
LNKATFGESDARAPKQAKKKAIPKQNRNGFWGNNGIEAMLPFAALSLKLLLHF